MSQLGQGQGDKNPREEVDKVEQTFIMIKPDGVQRGLIGRVIQRFERKGLQLTAMKFVKASEEMIAKMYNEERDQPYFPNLLKIMTSGPVVPMIWKGPDAIGIGRRVISELVTEHSLPGTIRGDYCLHAGRNVVHGADSVQEATFDISLWF